jgi:uncharacterized protein
MRQTWHELLFAHWPMSAGSLRSTLPPGLTLDTFEGQAWVGVVAFHMSDVRLRFCPELMAARFPEINLRTYVTTGGKPGVFFYSLDAGSRLAVWAARTFFALPYFTARFDLHQTEGRMDYACQRTHRPAAHGEFRARYQPAGPVFASQPGTLEQWLTERYCLYTADRRGQLMRGDIHHPPWPLQPAEAQIQVETLSRAAGITRVDTTPLLHYARQLNVLIWPLQRLSAE